VQNQYIILLIGTNHTEPIWKLAQVPEIK